MRIVVLLVMIKIYKKQKSTSTTVIFDIILFDKISFEDFPIRSFLYLMAFVKMQYKTPFKVASVHEIVGSRAAYTYFQSNNFV